MSLFLDNLHTNLGKKTKIKEKIKKLFWKEKAIIRLNSLDARILKDLGIHHTEVNSIIRGNRHSRRRSDRSEYI